MILGILDYVRERGPWNVSLIHGGPNDIHIPQTDTWHGDGLIGRIPSDAVAREIAAAHLPTVLIDPEESHLKSNRRLVRCSSISCDSAASPNWTGPADGKPPSANALRKTASNRPFFPSTAFPSRRNVPGS